MALPAPGALERFGAVGFVPFAFQARTLSRGLCTPVQPNWAHPSFLSLMCCAYGGLAATMKIVSNPQQVCFEHAVEFWTGLLANDVFPLEPCVKQESVCTCRSCEAVSATCRRVTAIAVAGPSPRDTERFPIPHAS
jgi:hypothetical protein